MRAPFFLIACCTLLLTACGNSGKAGSGSSGRPAEQLHITTTGPDKIAFLNFDVSFKDSAADTYNFRLKNTIFADGVLKGKDLVEEPVVEKFYFYCQLSNKSDLKSAWIRVPDPLNTVFEHPGEGDNDLGKSVFRKSTGECSIRFQWNSNFKYLEIYKADSKSLKLKRIYYAEILH